MLLTKNREKSKIKDEIFEKKIFISTNYSTNKIFEFIIIY